MPLEQQPPVRTIAVVNRQWKTSDGSEDTSALLEQVVVYVPREINSDDEIVKQVGLMQAIADLSNTFNSTETQLSVIDTDITRVVVGSFDEICWFFAEFPLHERLPSAEQLIRKIKDAHALFVLNHGSISDCEAAFEGDRDAVRRLVSDWWTVWMNNMFENTESCNVGDDALFTMFDGIRCSSVEKPYGFTDNFHIAISELIDSDPELNEVFVVNSNWIPEKNWGVLYLNEESVYSRSSLHSLVNHLKDIDIGFGLSTAALKQDNWPSLKSLNTVESDRSLADPVIHIQSKLANSVFNPISDAFESFESYVPIIGTVNQMSEYVSPSITAVSELTMKPWNSLVSYWKGESIPEEAEEQTQPPIVPVESRTLSRRSGNPAVDESMQTEHQSGVYILGLTNQGVITKKYMMQETVENTLKEVKCLIYEINGILFVLLYNKSVSDTKNFYDNLTTRLDSLYQKFFSELIMKQVESIEAEHNSSKDDTPFSYIIYDEEKYWTNIDNIPLEEDMLSKQTPQRRRIIEHNLNSTLSKSGDTLTRHLALSLMQTKQLQFILKDITRSPLNDDLVGTEKLSKIGRNLWCSFKRYNETRWVIVVKRLDKVDTNSRSIHLFGSTVHEWLQWVDGRGYL